MFAKKKKENSTRLQMTVSDNFKFSKKQKTILINNIIIGLNKKGTKCKMTKCIRKSVSILLMAAMVLTTVLSYTPDIVYGQGYEPNLKAKIDGDKLGLLRQTILCS